MIKTARKYNYKKYYVSTSVSSLKGLVGVPLTCLYVLLPRSSPLVNLFWWSQNSKTGEIKHCTSIKIHRNLVKTILNDKIEPSCF